MQWQKTRLGDLYEVHNGLSKPREAFGSGWPFLSYSVVFNNFFLPKTLDSLVQSTDKEQASYSIKAGDIFVTRTSETPDELGMSCVALKDYPHATYNGFCKRLRPTTDKVCPGYIGYYLRTPEFRSRLAGLGASMITRASLRNEDLLSLAISLPPLPTQRAIAEKLGRYDALIENNTRRIAILEAKAEQLYKEWFVRKREIGNVGGWHKGKLGDVCYLKRGKNITSSEMKPGNIPVIAAGLEPSGYHDNANVHGVSITMSSSGANAGFIGIHYSDIWAADCAYASEGDTPNIYFAYEVLNNLRPVIDNFKMGAAQPHVYPKHINAIKIEVPPEGLMAEANNRLSTIHHMIANLQRQNALLTKERDLLLPRLISGRVKP